MDKSKVKKVDTFKSGRFPFSWNYSSEAILELQVRASILYRTIADLPILPDLASKLEEDVIRRSIFGTAAIEGNPLTEEQVGEVLELFPEGGPSVEERAEREISNLRAAYRLFDEVETEDLHITEELLRKIHKLITLGIEHPENVPGKYRSHIVKIGDKDHGGIYTPPKILDDIKMLMKELGKWINSKKVMELGPTIRAGMAHYHLALIHPFGDGNGRTARLIEALIMRCAGIRYAPLMLSNYYYKNIDEYFLAFSKSIKNKEKNVTPFLEFVFKGLCESLEEIKGVITHFIRLFTMRDYFASLREGRGITQRQHDLLGILLDYLAPFTLNDLYSKPLFRLLYRSVSERTARRDLHKLESMNILTKKSGGYLLNLRALD